MPGVRQAVGEKIEKAEIAGVRLIFTIPPRDTPGVLREDASNPILGFIAHYKRRSGPHLLSPEFGSGSCRQQQGRSQAEQPIPCRRRDHQGQLGVAKTAQVRKVVKAPRNGLADYFRYRRTGDEFPLMPPFPIKREWQNRLKDHSSTYRRTAGVFNVAVRKEEIELCEH